MAAIITSVNGSIFVFSQFNSTVPTKMNQSFYALCTQNCHYWSYDRSGCCCQNSRSKNCRYT